MSIVVTGATGGLGSLVVQYLLKRVPTSEIVVTVRHPEKAAALAEQGIEVRYGDYDDPASLQKAFAGADKLLLISSSLLDDTARIRQHATAIEAAKNAKVGHIIYTGVGYAEKISMTLAQVHLASEQALRTTGIPYTILRNTFYTHLYVNPGLKAAVERGELVTSAGNGKLNTATRSNFALAAATVLTQKGHENKIYELTGSQPWTFDDLAQLLSQVSGKKVVHRSVSESEIGAELKQLGMPEDFIPFQIMIYRTIASGEFASTSNDLQKLIGSAYTPIEASVRELF
ncbi:SDR family oxidoreductase [Dictyobacter arantiisoli]|uniref:NAD(P)-dependent oxidoreductase n=1 Tax=Dictyobacter arantiisoli TaxID=2014874 RepID=A0A5A5TKF6_9CHLR|nr:SDR family oxidoreductase [Dictyobacter arantiisoli]GCF11566.1 NAD(P)-dependent oxidoreductase [Dictyobacter arantiisoli]